MKQEEKTNQEEVTVLTPADERIREAEARTLSESDIKILRDGFETVYPVIDWPPVDGVYPKVLVCCPTYDGKSKDLERFMKLVTNLEYPNYDIALSDNSERKGGPFFKRLDSYPKGNAGTKTVYQTRRSATSRQSICKSRNQLLKHFLEGDYDYMMSIEFDLLPPKNIITELLQYQVPVIGAMYEIGYEHKASHLRDAGKYPLIHVGARKALKERQGDTFLSINCAHCGLVNHIGNRTRQLTREEIKYFVDGKVKRVHGFGVGCTLIERKVFDTVKEFRVDLQFAYHDDTFFYLDLWNNNIPAFLHTGYNIEHNNDDWQAIADF